jgi:hypothetical protein
MNNKELRNKKIGLGVIVLAMIVSFFLFYRFNLFGAKLDYQNTSLLLKMFFATVILPI